MNIAITSKSFNKHSPYLQNIPYKIIYHDKKQQLTEQEIIQLTNHKTIGIIAGTEPITQKVIDNTPNLKVISRYGTGTDNINIKHCKNKNIKIYTTSSPTSVAELTVLFMLMLIRKIHKTEIGNTLSNKKIGIIGFGNIGKKVLELLRFFDVTYIVYDIFSPSLDQLIKESDIITIHLPLTSETYHLISKHQLAMMKPTAYLINTSRSEIIDENALYETLKNKKIAGAALDVHTIDFSSLDNVILTDHIGSYTVEAQKQMEEETINNLIKGLK